MSAAVHERIVVFGAGAFGTALAALLSRAGRDVTLLGRNAAAVAAMSGGRANPRLHHIDLPATLSVTTDVTVLRDAAIVLCGIPSQAMGEALAAQAERIGQATPVVVCAKGIEKSTGRFPDEIAKRALGGNPVALLSGPGFAGEIARGLPTAMTLASRDEALADRLSAALSTPTFRLYASADMRGVAAGGALKNVMAIASGISDGMGLGASARAALIARGLAEMTRFAVAQGASRETLAGLSGLGDLVLTATSDQSRNMRFGIMLGQGAKPSDLLAEGQPLSEGAWTAGVARDMAAKAGIDAPVISAVADVVSGAISAQDAVRGLLARPLRREHEAGQG